MTRTRPTLTAPLTSMSTWLPPTSSLSSARQSTSDNGQCLAAKFRPCKLLRPWLDVRLNFFAPLHTAAEIVHFRRLCLCISSSQGETRRQRWRPISRWHATACRRFCTLAGCTALGVLRSFLWMISVTFSTDCTVYRRMQLPETHELYKWAGTITMTANWCNHREHSILHTELVHIWLLKSMHQLSTKVISRDQIYVLTEYFLSLSTLDYNDDNWKSNCSAHSCRQFSHSFTDKVWSGCQSL